MSRDIRARWPELRHPSDTSEPHGASLAASAVAAPPSTSSPDGALTGVPASWAGFGALLAGAGERAPADALRLAAVTAGTADRVDLSGMWALPADPAAPRSHELIRAPDDRGRLMLPITVTEATTVPTERDGALVTVFLPGSTDRPRPGFAAAALPLDARGRLYSVRRGPPAGRHPRRRRRVRRPRPRPGHGHPDRGQPPVCRSSTSSSMSSERSAFTCWDGGCTRRCCFWETADQDASLDDSMLEWAAIWKSLPKVVFSATLPAVQGDARLATRGLAEEIEQWRAEPGQGDIAIGGPTLAGEAAALGLIDEYRVRVYPVLVGGGTSFFPRAERRVGLELADSRTFLSGVVYLVAR
jgi:hypothetical protein